MATPAIETRFESLEQQDHYYVWDLVVRLTHWLNVAAVAVLLYTGFQIGGYVSRSPVDEPTFGFSMATMRNWHTLAAYVFACNGAIRLYWIWAGKTYGQWFRYHVWQPKFWKEISWKLIDYVSLRYVGKESYTLGHNALASFAYTGLFVIGAVLTLTGFALKGQIDPGGTMQTLFGWVIPLLGSDANVRMVHRFSMWLMIAFMIHHIGIVVLLESLGESGLISSIFSGRKTRPKGWKPSNTPWKDH